VLEYKVAEQQQVNVERPRAVARAVWVAAKIKFDLLYDIEQLDWPKGGANLKTGVKKVRLVKDLADRLCLPNRRRRDHLHSSSAQACDASFHLSTAVAQV
jgi:hypothetical protein